MEKKLFYVLEGNTILINSSAHKINMIDRKPASIDKEEYEKLINNNETIELDNYYTLNAKNIDKEIYDEDDNTYKLIKSFDIDNEEIEKFDIAIKSLIADIIGNGIKINKVKIFVSLPILLNLKYKIEEYVNKDIDYKIELIGVINATNRGIYPPIACLRYYGSID